MYMLFCPNKKIWIVNVKLFLNFKVAESDLSNIVIPSNIKCISTIKTIKKYSCKKNTFLDKYLFYAVKGQI